MYFPQIRMVVVHLRVSELCSLDKFRSPGPVEVRFIGWALSIALSRSLVVLGGGWRVPRGTGKAEENKGFGPEGRVKRWHW